MKKSIKVSVKTEEVLKKIFAGLSYWDILEVIAGISPGQEDFACQVCLNTGVPKQDAVREISEGFVPKPETKVKGLICGHCHISGF